MEAAISQPQLKSKQVNKLKPMFNELAHFLLLNNIKYNETAELLKVAFIDAASKLNNNSSNVSAISLKTGIDRRQISMVQSTQETEDQKPRKTSDPIILTLGELFHYQKDNHTNLLPKKGPGDSLYNFCNKCKGRLTAPTIVKELIELGCIELIGKNEVKIIKTELLNKQSDSRKYDYATNQFFKVVNTLRKNIEDPDNSVLEWSVESTQINQDNKKKLSDELKQIRDSLRVRIIEKVDQYESSVEEGTYEPFSLNFYVNSQGT